MTNSILHVSLAACTDKPRYEFADIMLSSGHLIHVIGPNGAGKSTFLSLLAGLLRPDKVSLVGLVGGNKGDNVQHITPGAPMWHQHRGYYCAQFAPSFALTVADIMAFFRLESTSAITPDKYEVGQSEQTILADELEDVFAIRQFWHRSISELSTGQQNRVHLARICQQIYPALQAGQGLLLLDEAFSGLDIYFQQQLMAVIQRWVRLGNIVVHAHHELHSLARYPDDEVVVIAEGKLKQRGRIASLDWPHIHQSIFHVDTI